MHKLLERFIAGDPRFRLCVDHLDPGRGALSASGELESAAAERLEALIRGSEAAGHTFVTLNLAAVTSIDCVCLRVLVNSHGRLQAAGGGLILNPISRPVLRLLQNSDLDRMLLTAVNVTGPIGLVPESPRRLRPVAAGTTAHPGGDSVPDAHVVWIGRRRSHVPGATDRTPQDTPT